MIEFVIGGTAQGKLKYVLDKNNLTKEDVCNGEECDYNNINKKKISTHFTTLLRKYNMNTLSSNTNNNHNDCIVQYFSTK